MDIDSTNEGNESGKTFSKSEQYDQLFNYLASLNNVHFKSQQIGDPELSIADKRAIVADVFNRNVCTFLSRFGPYLLTEHVPIFEKHPDYMSYEVQYYLNKLRNNQIKPASKVQIKNRRFEAMKRLMSEGEYFSVGEMRKRNPLLFDQLLGNFLKNPETRMSCSDHPIADLLLEQIEQDQVAALKQSQIEAEMKDAEEFRLSDDNDDTLENCNNVPVELVDVKESDVKLWGKTYKSNHVIGKSRWKNKHPTKRASPIEDDLTQEEKVLLINEFTSTMFNNFLQGKDEFDYNEVDNNPEYDDMYQCDVDEEEKYFDSESPEHAEKDAKQPEDDEFDKFMKDIDHQVASENLAESLRNMDPTDS